LDGRPSASARVRRALWQGFSTGKWDGDMLTVTTTHLKMGWIRRNGIPRSDKAVLTEHFVRHDDTLTLIAVIQDPVYLTEPFVRTTNWRICPARARSRRTAWHGYGAMIWCRSIRQFVVRTNGSVRYTGS